MDDEAYAGAKEAADLKRDAIARVIDPESWELHDDSRLINRDPNVREMLVKDSRATAATIMASGVLASIVWERKEFIKARQALIVGTSRTGKCYEVSDLMDGYVMHDPRCPLWPDGAISSSRQCIK